LQKNGIVEAHRLLSHCIYLEDDSIVIDGVKFHGSPWQPWFYDWAFNLRYEEQLAEKWAKIPDDTHVLITHTPPHQICDYTVRGNNIGSTSLLERVLKVQPKIHVFGHAHAPSRSGGPVGNTLFCNVADDLRIKEAMVLDLIGGEASMVTTL
jgi:Icc-related predicted phosphoesterase